MLKRFRPPLVMAAPTTLLPLCLLIAGCGGGGASDAPQTLGVSGTVTLDGQPLPEATVTFLPMNLGEGLSPASGRTDRRGDYQLQFNAAQSGVKPGSYKVAITTVQTNEDGEDISPETLPEVYNRKTGLTANVTADQRTFDFALKSDAGPVPKQTAGE